MSSIPRLSGCEEEEEEEEEDFGNTNVATPKNSPKSAVYGSAIKATLTFENGQILEANRPTLNKLWCMIP